MRRILCTDFQVVDSGAPCVSDRYGLGQVPHVTAPTRYLPIILISLAALLFGDDVTPRPDGPAAPATLTPDALDGLEGMHPQRRKLVELALKEGRENRLSRYIFGSADPARGGFDCSGAMFYLLLKMGIDPPRSSATQFDWIEEAGLLVKVPAGITSMDDESFDKLRPGDLLFWAGTYDPKDGRTNRITHVQMYLGKEKKDGRRVMIGSTDGRSYRGRRQCGFGVYDFKLPGKQSKSRFVGYGTVPGLLKGAE
jgi:hypothetical protein